MDPRSQEWDHFFHPNSHYLTVHSPERGKAQTPHWVKVNVRADFHCPILAALYSWSFPPISVLQVPSPFLFLFSVHFYILPAFQLLFFSPFPIISLLENFIMGKVPSTKHNDSWQAFISNIISLAYNSNSKEPETQEQYLFLSPFLSFF